MKDDENEYEAGYRAGLFGDTIRVELIFTQVSDAFPRYVEIDIESVRSADSVRVSYDYDRDGWSVEQARFFSWAADDKVRDAGWTEVAFVRAWGSMERGGHVK
jgi:hypothetical protein